MGIGDIGVSLWGECEQQDGMHLGARGFVHAELIDPETGAALEIDGRRHAASWCSPICGTGPRRCCASAPATTSQVRTGPCACGRTGPRVRCIGRTDDMLIVRGVNVFPSAVREVVSGFAPGVSGQIAGRARARRAPSRSRRCRSRVELAPGDGGGRRRLPRRSGARLREPLVVQAEVELVPWGSLQRSEYKSKLVER